MNNVVFFIFGIFFGGVVAWIVATRSREKSSMATVAEADKRANVADGRASALSATVEELRGQVSAAARDFQALHETLGNEKAAKVQAETRLAETVERLHEEKELLENAKNRLTETFKAIAGDTLNDSTTAFLRLAEERFDKILAETKGDLGKRQEALQGLVKPLTENLQQFQALMRDIENNRTGAYSGLSELIKGLSTAQQQLITALRRPEVRGRWGEITLRRVIEFAGMCDYCDFAEQVSKESEGARLRPDLIIRLPADREIVVDSKVSLDAYLDATSADTDGKRQEAMSRHAAQVRIHMANLADKKYWAQFERAPEFVIMFIPIEASFIAAIESDRTLYEDAIRKHIIIATPMTLIAITLAVAVGWRQDSIARNAQEISDLGKQLYERIKTMADHWSEVGRGLEKANQAYNSAVGSMELRLLPAVRRFKELGAVPASGADIPIIPPIDTTPRKIIPIDSLDA